MRVANPLSNPLPFPFPAPLLSSPRFSFSNLLGETVAEHCGYDVAFAGLGTAGLVPLLLISLYSTDVAGMQDRREKE